jgi:hypothetical protein
MRRLSSVFVRLVCFLFFGTSNPELLSGCRDVLFSGWRYVTGNAFRFAKKHDAAMASSKATNIHAARRSLFDRWKKRMLFISEQT